MLRLSYSCSNVVSVSVSACLCVKEDQSLTSMMKVTQLQRALPAVCDLSLLCLSYHRIHVHLGLRCQQPTCDISQYRPIYITQYSSNKSQEIIHLLIPASESLRLKILSQQSRSSAPSLTDATCQTCPGKPIVILFCSLNRSLPPGSLRIPSPSLFTWDH